MQVRLAFSVMVQVDADILLIDEVLAVGDVSFQQKCFDVFNRLRDEGKTILFVTHDMAAGAALLPPRRCCSSAARCGRSARPSDVASHVPRAELRPRGDRRPRRRGDDRALRRRRGRAASRHGGSRTSRRAHRRCCPGASRARSTCASRFHGDVENPAIGRAVRERARPAAVRDLHRLGDGASTGHLRSRRRGRVLGRFDKAFAPGRVLRDARGSLYRRASDADRPPPADGIRGRRPARTSRAASSTSPTTCAIERARARRQRQGGAVSTRSTRAALGGRSGARRARRRPAALRCTSSVTLAVIDFKLRYFGSVLGYLWQLMRPLMLFGVLYVVFTEFVQPRRGRQLLPGGAADGHRAVHVLRRTSTGDRSVTAWSTARTSCARSSSRAS